MLDGVVMRNEWRALIYEFTNNLYIIITSHKLILCNFLDQFNWKTTLYAYYIFLIPKLKNLKNQKRFPMTPTFNPLINL